MDDKISILQNKLSNCDAQTGLQYIAAQFGNEAVFSTSFGIEDQVITAIIASYHLPITIFTLDTGRLFAETYSVWDRTIEKYDSIIETYYPNQQNLKDFVTTHGPNSFYNSVNNRLACCNIRKVEPLALALKNKKIWITGIRKEQSADRNIDSCIEWDEKNNIIKYHPLLNWSFDEVNDYVLKNNVPINTLHDKGFVSIGCQPCTRAIKPGENFRAGRWWWEVQSKKECGLHNKN
jgi:phosphoadenosine phosphosulfate reductase